MANSQHSNGDSRKVIVQHVHIEETEDDVPPPPPVTSTFNNLQDWLLNICDHDKPKKSITQYKFGLFESSNDNILFLVGVNTYDEGKNRSETRIEFKPSNMYFKLPKSEYGSFNREQLMAKLIAQLKDFTNTEKFRSSFLSKANSILFELNGHTIWSK